MIPDNLLYSEEHEWIKKEGEQYILGITNYAQEQLTEVVYVELPEVGRKIQKGDVIAVLESVKSVAEVYSPCVGEVLETNEHLEESPQHINEDPYGQGWICKLSSADIDESAFMDASSYEKFVDSQEH